MSFYDSASLAFLPSGGAGKDGKAYSIKPVPEYGNELVTNGGFDTDSYWTKETGWSIANGKATQDGSAVGAGGAGDLVSGGTIFQIGKTYLIKIDIVDYVSGDLDVTSSNIPLSANKDGSYYTYYTAATAYLHIRAGYSSFIGSIDNVSVKEVIVDGDFTFSRGSNLTATRVDSNGLIEKGRENLLLQSNQFDTTWSSSNFTLTPNQSGYDGSSDAWKAAVSVSYAGLIQNVNGSGVYTFSGYFRKGDSNEGIRFNFDASTDTNVYVNLTDGSSTFNGGLIERSITDAGNGFYKVVVTANLTNLTAVRIFVTNGTTTQVAGNIYIQDAQLEIGLVATEYIESGATKGKAGLLENEPRFDYSNGASCPSLLLEPSRTQLVTQSEYFGGYSNSNSTDEPNATTSPEGLTNATSFLEAATTGQHKLTTSLSFDGSSTYTFSIFAKTNGRDLYIDTQNSNEWGGRAWFDLTNGTANSVLGTANIEDFGNGWYRCIVTGESTLAGGNLVELLTSDGSTNSTTGDITKGVFIYGAQMEQGSYSSSYIPNHSGGSVTRDGDSCSDAGDASTFNDSEGVLYAEIAAIADDQTSKVISLSDGTFDERVLIATYSGGSNQIRVFIKSGGSFSATITTTLTDITEFNKIAYRYKSGETKLFINGSLIDTSTDTFSISGLNALQLASGTPTATPFYGNAKQVIVFNTALSNTDCEILTGTSYESFSAMAAALNYTTYE